MIITGKALLAAIALTVAPVAADYSYCDIDYVVFNADKDIAVGLLDDIVADGYGYFCIPDYQVNIQARPTPDCPTTLSAFMDLHGPVAEDERLENAGPCKCGQCERLVCWLARIPRKRLTNRLFFSVFLPDMIFGDNNRDPINYFGRDLLPGYYVLGSDIYSEKRAKGDLVVSRIVEFEAKYCDVEPPTDPPTEPPTEPPVKPPMCEDKFVATLSGDEEVPAVYTDVTGDAYFKVDRYEGTITFDVSVLDNGAYVGLLGAAGAHIHCAPKGENGPVVAFLAGVVPGGLVGEVLLGGSLTADNIVDTTCGATIEELIDSFCAGQAYVNIHSLENGPGEVRGQIYPKY